jgi:hypothetical protein
MVRRVSFENMRRAVVVRATSTPPIGPTAPEYGLEPGPGDGRGLTGDR